MGLRNSIEALLCAIVCAGSAMTHSTTTGGNILTPQDTSTSLKIDESILTLGNQTVSISVTDPTTPHAEPTQSSVTLTKVEPETLSVTITKVKPTTWRDNLTVSEPTTWRDNLTEVVPTTWRNNLTVSEPTTWRVNLTAVEPTTWRDNLTVSEPTTRRDNLKVSQPITWRDNLTVSQPTTWRDNLTVSQPTTWPDTLTEVGPTTWRDNLTEVEQTTWRDNLTEVEPTTWRDNLIVSEPTTWRDNLTVSQPTSWRDNLTVSEPTTWRVNLTAVEPTTWRDNLTVSEPTTRRDNLKVSQPITWRDNLTVSQPTTWRDNLTVSQPTTWPDTLTEVGPTTWRDNLTEVEQTTWRDNLTVSEPIIWRDNLTAVEPTTWRDNLTVSEPTTWRDNLTKDETTTLNINMNNFEPSALGETMTKEETTTLGVTKTNIEQTTMIQVDLTSLKPAQTAVSINSVPSVVGVNKILTYSSPSSHITISDTSAKSQETTTRSSLTTRAPENCMISRKAEFIKCFEGLGNNAMKYIVSKNLTGFLDDICDANMSKPHMECIKRHFSECPDFLNRIEVQVLQFGPYHIKDIIYFSSIDQMCSCATGLICIQELLKVKEQRKLTLHTPNSAWPKLPNMKAICEYNTSRYIGCVRGNLRVCQSPLTKRYGADFTNDDADDIKEMYDFTKEHCAQVNLEDFDRKYACIEKKSTSNEFKDCIHNTEQLSSGVRMCKMRQCVLDIIEDECDADDLIPLYIDAVNIYRRDSVRLLNKPCSSAIDVGISLATLIMAVCIVFMF